MATDKTCATCKESFPATTDYFNVRRFSADGLNGYCKPCSRAYQRQYDKESRKAEKKRRIQRLIDKKFGATLKWWAKEKEKPHYAKFRNGGS